MKGKGNKFLIGGIIVFLAIGSLAFASLQNSTSFFLTVSELKQQESSLYGKPIKVNGEVVPGSIEDNIGERTLLFTITEGGQSLSVVFYRGTVPDNFEAGREVIVDGKLNTDGIFEAHTIMAQCPSKYDPELLESGQEG
ncbi:MAG: cytochrome c maturation protein CcmE [Dehalococcoidales bacterium]|nr:cytochrome c maturation protein CcmE [Dehalococcoidales bacterium]